MKSTTRRGFLVGGTVAAAAVAGGLHYATSKYDTVITRWWSGTFTQPVSNGEAPTADEAKQAGHDLSVTISGEGIVMLKNDGLLPAPAGNVALLGYSALNPVYIGAGSVSQGDGSTELIDFFKGFERAGYTVDQGMREWYEGDGKAVRESTDMFSMMGSDYNIYDQPIDNYRSTLDAASASADTAIVVFGRTGGEGGDLPLDMASYQNGAAGRHYLELQPTEEDLLEYAKENFKHVVVILDSSNAMQLGFLEDEKINAAFWIGAPGSSGIEALPKIMTGEVNPSGHLVDIFPYDVKSNPTYYTCTAGTYNNYDEFIDDAVFDNMVDEGVTWYAEGIYEGYRYYETAAAEGIIDYDTTVQFPFGYGLSYTNFDWKVGSSTLGGTHEDIKVEVTVTNTGTVAGKDVVQLYAEPPYTPGGIEKSARVLVAFAKTKLLDPGASDTVTLSFNADELASYDYTGERCYVADAGDYMLHLQTDSHNDKDGCEPITYNVSATRVYNDSGVGKRASDFVVAENHFDPSSMGDGNIGATIPWMTRSDLKGTHPQTTMGGKHITEMDFGMGDECIDYMLNKSLGGSDIKWEDDDSYVCESLVPVAQGENNGLSCDDLAGYTEWNDEVWDKLVNQMSVDEQVALICDCAYGTPAVDSIGKQLATDVDGPAGISSMNLNYYGHQYCGEPVTAATWNVDLARQMGECVGDECGAAGVNGWYAPGCDTHRSAFGGRNAEYYSEDPLLSGKICAAEINGVQSKGVYVYLKHFAMNDQDNKRGGMYTWATEQAIREIYLKAFEYPVKEADAKAVMYAYNRIGPMECCVCRALTTNVLHGEWGSHASGLTDGYGAGEFAARGEEDGFRQQAHGAMYENPDLQIRAGGGQLLFLGGWNGLKGITERTTGSEKGLEMMHDMCKRILYIYCNSNIMTTKRDYTPYWKGVLYGVDALLAGGVALAWWKDSRLRKAEKEQVLAAPAGDTDKDGADKGSSAKG